MKKLLGFLLGISMFVPLVSMAGTNGQPACDISAVLNPTIAYPKNVTFTWSTRNGVSVSTSPDIGAVGTSGTVVYFSSSSNLYNMTVTNATGKTNSCSVRVH